jgi:hypothetical protein
MRIGMRLKSTVCTTEIIVVRTSKEDLDLRCGGSPMVPLDAKIGEFAGPAATFASGTMLGKRYVAGDFGLEVICSSAGAGSLSVGDQPLEVMKPRLLPSSD